MSNPAKALADTAKDALLAEHAAKQKVSELTVVLKARDAEIERLKTDLKAAQQVWENSSVASAAVAESRAAHAEADRNFDWWKEAVNERDLARQEAAQLKSELKVAQEINRSAAEKIEDQSRECHALVGKLRAVTEEKLTASAEHACAVHKLQITQDDLSRVRDDLLRFRDARDTLLQRCESAEGQLISKTAALEHTIRELEVFRADMLKAGQEILKLGPQFSKLEKSCDEADEALREIYMACGNSDPSDGEGTSPQEVVASVLSMAHERDIFETQGRMYRDQAIETRGIIQLSFNNCEHRGQTIRRQSAEKRTMQRAILNALQFIPAFLKETGTTEEDEEWVGELRQAAGLNAECPILALSSDTLEKLRLVQGFSDDMIASLSIAREYDLKKVAFAIQHLIGSGEDFQGVLLDQLGIKPSLYL